MDKFLLFEIREKRKLTQREVSEATGIAPEQISKYESGKITPSIESLLLLSQFYKVSLDHLTGKINSEEDQFLAAALLLQRQSKPNQYPALLAILDKLQSICS